MSKLAERMRYQKNSLCANMCLLSIAVNAAYLILCYFNNAHVPNAQLGLDVLYNIIFMLMAFLASEKIKAYSTFWSLGVILLGAAQAARIMWLPMMYYTAGMMREKWFIVFSVLLSLSGFMLILAGVIGFIRAMMLKAYMKKQGGTV